MADWGVLASADERSTVAVTFGADVLAASTTTAVATEYDLPDPASTSALRPGRSLLGVTVR